MVVVDDSFWKVIAGVCSLCRVRRMVISGEGSAEMVEDVVRQRKQRSKQITENNKDSNKQ